MILLIVCFSIMSHYDVLGQTGLSEADKQEILNAHNHFRSIVKPTASNMEKMIWNNELASVAQAYAEQCVFDYNNNRQGTLDFRSVGENFVVYVPSPVNYTSLVERWNNEVNDYDYVNNNCTSPRVCSHYTQLVWAVSNNLGCGAYRCTDSLQGFPFSNTFLLVCDYGPGGNTGQRPYTHGEACSACPEDQINCVQNLCSASMIVLDEPTPASMDQTTTMPDHQTNTQTNLPAFNESATLPTNNQTTTIPTDISITSAYSHIVSTTVVNVQTTTFKLPAYSQIAPSLSMASVTMATTAINETATLPTVTSTITYNPRAAPPWPTITDSLSQILYSVAASVVVPFLIFFIIFIVTVVCWRRRQVKSIKTESVSKDPTSADLVPTHFNVSYDVMKKETRKRTDGSAAYSMQMIPNTSYGKITVNTADSVLMTQNMSYGDLDIRNIAVTGISAKDHCSSTYPVTMVPNLSYGNVTMNDETDMRTAGENQKYLGHSVHKQSMKPEYEEIDENGMVPNPVHVEIGMETPSGIQHPVYILESWNGDLSQSSLRT